MIAWKESTLGEICDVGQGVIKTGPFGSQLHQRDYSDSGTPVVMPKDIVGGRVSESSIARVSTEHVERLSHHQLRHGDIVYGRRGDIGRCALVTPRESGWLCGTGCLRIHLGDGEVSPEFLFYYLNNPSTVNWIYNQAVGATMPNLNTGILRSIPIHYPDRETQGRIAFILSTYDDLIENNSRRIEILEEMARRLYEEWFVHFRFPGHQEVEFKESELGVIPEGWEVKGLYDIAEVTYGHPFKAKQFNEQGEGLGAVRIRDIRGGQVKTYTTEEGKPKHIIENGDILVGMDGQFHMGKWAGGKAWLVQRVARFRPVLPMSRYLLFLTIERPIKHLEETIVGTTVAHLSAKDLKAMKVVVPDEAMLNMTANTLEPLYELEMRLKRKNDNLRAQRDLLLPKLVSGEIDVSNFPMPDDKEIEAA